jgi:hypothetical protein
MRVLLAFLLAPTVPAVLYGLVSLVITGGLGSAPLVLFLCAVYGYPAMLFAGLPLFVHFGCGTTAPHILHVVGVAAAVGSAVPGAIVLLLGLPIIFMAPGTLDAGTLLGLLKLMAFGAVLGGGIGCAFWVLAYGGRRHA